MAEIREPSAEYARRKEAPAFFGEPEKKGKVVFEQKAGNTDQQSPSLYYDHPNGGLWVGDAVAWLASLSTGSVDLIFADPPYNIKKAEWDTFESQQKYVEWSLDWIEQAARILKPTGTMYVCGFSEILADLKLPASRFFKGCRWLVWHYKNKANLGNDWGRSHESLLHFRKSKKFTLKTWTTSGYHTARTHRSTPLIHRAKTSNFGNGKKRDNWTPHPSGAKPKDVIEIPTTSNGMHEKTPHPTQKPEELVRKVVLASSNPGDVVIDPFLGSGTTAVVSEQLGRKWKGCDLSAEYCGWAANRIELVEDWPVEKWLLYDSENTVRRKAIR